MNQDTNRNNGGNENREKRTTIFDNISNEVEKDIKVNNDIDGENVGDRDEIKEPRKIKPTSIFDDVPKKEDVVVEDKVEDKEILKEEDSTDINNDGVLDEISDNGDKNDILDKEDRDDKDNVNDVLVKEEDKGVSEVDSNYMLENMVQNIEVSEDKEGNGEDNSEDIEYDDKFDSILKEDSGDKDVKGKKMSFSLVIIFAVFVVLIIGIVLVYNIMTKDSDGEGDNIGDVENSTMDDEVLESNFYNFGDMVSLTQLSGYVDGDYSSWVVLNDDGEYVTLISDKSFGLGMESNVSDMIEGYKADFILYGIDFGTDGELRLMNENELIGYFGCDFSSLVCNVSGIWSEYDDTNSILTSVYLDDKVLSLDFDYTLESNEIGTGEYFIYPVMVILKTNI